jgi:dTDP-4-amino-4,6-dideoxygalactose transaminase
MKYKLAYHTNNPSILKPLPHEVWPPNADEEELRELACQRNKDIGIKGCTGPIKELEDNFKDFLDNKVKYALTFNSGTSA